MKIKFSPFSQEGGGNAINGEAILLQPECFQFRTLTNLRGNLAHLKVTFLSCQLWVLVLLSPNLVTVENKLGGLQSGDIRGDLGDLVV